MADFNKTYQQIEQYLQGQLSLEEKRAFENQLLNDPSLQLEVDAHRLANEVIVENQLSNEAGSFMEKRKSTKNKYKFGIAALTAGAMLSAGVMYTSNKADVDTGQIEGDSQVTVIETAPENVSGATVDINDDGVVPSTKEQDIPALKGTTCTPSVNVTDSCFGSGNGRELTFWIDFSCETGKKYIELVSTNHDESYSTNNALYSFSLVTSDTLFNLTLNGSINKDSLIIIDRPNNCLVADTEPFNYTIEIDQHFCSADETGSLWISHEGSSSYSYALDGGAYSAFPAIHNLSAGTHDIEIWNVTSDEKQMATVDIIGYDCSAYAFEMEEACKGKSDGVLEFKSKGDSAFTVSIDSLTWYDSPHDFEELEAGTYDFWIGTGNISLRKVSQELEETLCADQLFEEKKPIELIGNLRDGEPLGFSELDPLPISIKLYAQNGTLIRVFDLDQDLNSTWDFTDANGNMVGPGYFIMDLYFSDDSMKRGGITLVP